MPEHQNPRHNCNFAKQFEGGCPHGLKVTA